MLMNIQILIELKEYIDKYNFVLEELSVRSDIENMPMDEMMSNGIDEIVTFLNIINDIDKLINALTEHKHPF